ncbi:MAG: J domain-containing protein [Thermoproteota archaeon]
MLGIAPDATAGEIRQAYVRLAKMYHPDKNSSPDATIRMAEINLAYETLRDVQRRKEYDIENNIAEKGQAAQEFFDRYAENEDEEISEEEQEPTRVFGKCVRCNFVSNSGMFVCSVCGSVFDPHSKRKKHREEADLHELLDEEEEDALSEIIRCPRCNEINKFSSGLCWQCDLHFEIEELA